MDIASICNSIDEFLISRTQGIYSSSNSFSIHSIFHPKLLSPRTNKDVLSKLLIIFNCKSILTHTNIKSFLTFSNSHILSNVSKPLQSRFQYTSFIFHKLFTPVHFKDKSQGIESSSKRLSIHSIFHPKTTPFHINNLFSKILFIISICKL